MKKYNRKDLTPRDEYGQFRKLTSQMSPLPVLMPQSDYIKNAEELTEYADRIDEGAELFLLDVVDDFKKLMILLAPDIVGFNYERDLKIGVIQGMKDLMSSVALYYDGSATVLGDKDKEVRTVLFFGMLDKSPTYVQVLAKWSPWPAPLVPFKVEKTEATIIARIVTEDEMEEVREKILDNKDIIQAEFVKVDIKADLYDSSRSEGTDVSFDIGHAILRHELGIKEKPSPHWGPALDDVKVKLEDFMGKFVEFVETGDKGGFSKVDNKPIDKAKYQQGSWFAKRIEPE